MKTQLTFLNLFVLICALVTLACGGQQKQSSNLETRPLEESKALEIISNMLTERGYITAMDMEIELSTKTRFKVDFRVNGHKMAIEYLTRQDRTTIGDIPPAAVESRLHVLPAKAVSEDPGEQGEPVYIFIIDEKKYIYQYNPTSENRSDVTYLEVESRLRRDLADFLSWYESSRANEK